MIDYRVIFESVELSLIAEGSKTLQSEKIRENLEPHKHFEDKKFTDNEYYRILIDVIFYSGFRAATVTAKLSNIHEYFPDYELVASYSNDKVRDILVDEKMIRNRAKINACVRNAQVFKDIIQEHSSFQNYIDLYSPTTSFENLLLLKEELEYRFLGLGRITTYHFLTDIGSPVIKPDRVICRIFQRLGLIDNEGQLLKTVIQGRKFAEATGQPIRYIDIIFVAYGQMQSKEFGIEHGICLEKNPACSLCDAKRFCIFYSRNTCVNS
jgi:DNA-3-methyladenine glycosylase I